MSVDELLARAELERRTEAMNARIPVFLLGECADYLDGFGLHPRNVTNRPGR
jgi:hypothetical protein